MLYLRVASPVLACLLSWACCSPVARDQLGGVPDSSVDPNPRMPFRQDWVSASDLMIAVSESGKTASGYSLESGEWTKVTVNAQSRKDIVPLCISDCAMFTCGNQAYGFSAKTGKWSTVEIDEPVQPLAGANDFCFVCKEKAYGFSGKHGQWAVIKLDKSGTPPGAAVDRAIITIGSKLYVYSPLAGIWSMIDLTAD